jgi:hypothetical protein
MDLARINSGNSSVLQPQGSHLPFIDLNPKTDDIKIVNDIFATSSKSSTFKSSVTKSTGK